MDFTTKALNAVTPDDVRRFVDGHPPERDTLELKEALPAKSRDGDPWTRGQDSVGDYARDRILAEVIAFANAHGGMLLLGVRETDEHPKRAKGIAPVRACAELAARVRQQAGSCIDPQLPVVEIEGVATKRDGAGVVVIRVPQSRRAPHRLVQDGQCYIRRADRTEKMTMREIQDLTLSRAAGMAGIDRLFEERSAVFRAEAEGRALLAESRDLYAVRATLVPTTADVFVDPVYKNPVVRPPLLGEFSARAGRMQPVLSVPAAGFAERPILGGTRLFVAERAAGVRADVYRNGLIDLAFFWPVKGHAEDALCPEWIAGLALIGLLTADALRGAAGAAGAEYALEVELRRVGGAFTLAHWSGNKYQASSATIYNDPVVLPRLGFGARSQIPDVMRWLNRDLHEAAGIDVTDSPLEVEVPDPNA